eukprot:scaffold261166_cov20-Tisochrysis_lutea.AAC.1
MLYQGEVPQTLLGAFLAAPFPRTFYAALFNEYSVALLHNKFWKKQLSVCATVLKKGKRWQCDETCYLKGPGFETATGSMGESRSNLASKEFVDPTATAPSQEEGGRDTMKGVSEQEQKASARETLKRRSSQNSSFLADLLKS